MAAACLLLAVAGRAETVSSAPVSEVSPSVIATPRVTPSTTGQTSSATLSGTARGTSPSVALHPPNSARPNPTSTPVPITLKGRLDAIFDAPEWESGRWGVEVYDLDTSRALYEREANKAFMPASNMKLLTTAASLAALGGDFRFETRLYAVGRLLKDGTLRGDIVMEGSGDPSISGRYNEDLPTTAILQTWAEAIRKAGIRRVTGHVVGCSSEFEGDERAGSWQLDYFSDWYAAESTALAINENCWDVNIKPGERPGEPAVMEVPLRTKYVTFRNQVKTVAAGTEVGADSNGGGGGGAELETTAAADDGGGGIAPPGCQGGGSEDGGGDRVTTMGETLGSQGTTAAASTSAPAPKSHAQIEFVRDLEENVVILSGTIAMDSAPVHEWGSVHNGTLYAATLLNEELERQGVDVRGGPLDGASLPASPAASGGKAPSGAREKLCAGDPTRQRLLHVHVSPPLSRILAMVNKPSQNFYADMLLKVLGGLGNAGAAKGSFAAGQTAVRDFLTTSGVLGARALRMRDGSGLSRQDLVEPRSLLGLLLAMRRNPDFPAFQDSLPIMGVDGTLKSRLRGTVAEGNVRAKTGTINSVRCLSGYLTTADRHRLAFVMMANNFEGSTDSATKAQDRALLEIIKFSQALTEAGGSDGRVGNTLDSRTEHIVVLNYATGNAADGVGKSTTTAAASQARKTEPASPTPVSPQ